MDIDNNIYITGTFTSFGGVANNANGLAKFSTDGVFNQTFSDNLDVVFGTKASTSGYFVQPSINQGQGVLVEGNMLFIASSFGKFKDVPINARGLDKFSLDGVFDQSFKATMGTGLGPSGTVLTIDSDGESLYIGGTFVSWNGVSAAAPKIAKLSFDGELNQDFMDHLNPNYINSSNPGTPSSGSGFDSIVQTISVGIHGELLIGGQFQEFKNLKYERALILNADGSLPLR